MDCPLTGRDLLGGDFGTPADQTVDLPAVLPGLPPQEKARLSRELLQIVGNRSESLSARTKAAVAISFHGESLGLKVSVTMARALVRIFEAEFLGGRAARNKPLAQASILEASSHGRHYTFFLMLLAAIMAAHLEKGRLFGWRLAKLAAGTPLGSWLRRTLRAGERAPRPKSRRRRRGTK